MTQNRFKAIVFPVLAILAGCLFAALSSELIARSLTWLGFSTFVFREAHPELGTVLRPSVEGQHASCFDGYISTNTAGMRDRPRTYNARPGTFRIGLFGDSFLEAAQVKPNETFTYKLETALNETTCAGMCEVLNFGVASYSTVQEYLQYLSRGRLFDLDLVILLMIPNDIPANLDPGDPMAGSFYNAPYVSPTTDGFAIAPPRPLSASTRTTAWLSKHSTAVRYAAKSYYRYLRPHINYSADKSYEHLSSSIYAPYDTTTPKSDHTWGALVFLLDQFLKATQDDGVAFAISYIAAEDAFWWYPPPTSTSVSHFVPDMGRRIFRSFHERTGTPTYNLGAAIASHLRATHIPPPYFGFDCDPHFNPSGHKIVADSLLQFLIDTKLLPRPKMSN